MQIFVNGKRRFDSFMEFYVIHLKYQGVKIWLQYHFNARTRKMQDKHLLFIYAFKYRFIQLWIQNLPYRPLTYTNKLIKEFIRVKQKKNIEK